MIYGLRSRILMQCVQVHFARANALAAYKSKNMADIAAVRLHFVSCIQDEDVTLADKHLGQASGIVLHIERETNLHLTYCAGFGMTREEMEKTEEKMACTAYTRYYTCPLEYV